VFAGEGNLEITISARGRNIPTQVHPQGSARFIVSFVPLEGTDHIINITFNKELVPGAPFTAKIHTGNRTATVVYSIVSTCRVEIDTYGP
jgi:filamin